MAKMTDSQIINLKPAELLTALNDKEVIAQLRSDKALLNHALETLTEETLVSAFVKNKFAPKEAVAKYPMAFIEQFCEFGFNPGLEGILDLCVLSNSYKMDRAIAQLIHAFPTNKYDAGFIRALMNLTSSKSGAVVSETLAVLMQNSGVTLILLNDLKENNPAAFISVIGSLTGDLQTDAIALITNEVISQLEEDGERLLLAIKLIAKIRLHTVFSGYGHNFALDLLRSSSASRITDDEALFVVEYSSFNSQYEPIPYREAYENLPYSKNHNSLGRVLSGVPKGSKFFSDAFQAGKVELSAAEAFTMYLKGKDKLAAVLGSGTDSEMAEVIKDRAEIFADFISSYSITPAVLRDAIGRDRPEVAKAIYGIVGSEHRKQIASKYSDLKTSSGKTSVGEKHQYLITCIERKKGQDFLEGLVTYEPGVTTVDGGLKAFLNRHGQTTYLKKYDSTNLSYAFLKSLKDEELALRLIFASFRMGWSEAGQAFLSAKNAMSVLKSEKDSVSDVYLMTYEKDDFLALLPTKQLIELEVDDKDKNNTPKKAAALLAHSISENPPDKKLDISCKDTLTELAKLLTKKECVKHVSCRPFDGYEGNYNLVFKGGERFTGAELLADAKNKGYNIGNVLEALASIGADEELKQACLAIVSPKADRFAELFPKAGNRSSELKAQATKLLGGLNPDLVSVGDVIKKDKHLSEIYHSLGDNTVELLLKNETKRRPSIILDCSTPEISKSDLELLAAKYTLVIPAIIVNNLNDIKRIKNYIECGFPVERVSPGPLSAKDTRNQAVLRALVELSQAHPAIDFNFGRDVLGIASIEGCSSIMGKFEAEFIEESIKDIGSFEAAHKLDFPMANSRGIAEDVGCNKVMLKYAIDNGIRFNDFVVEVESYYWKEIEKLAKKARSIGLTLLPSDEYRSFTIYSHVFNQDGEIKDFEPISLSSLEMSDRVELIRVLSQKNPKYKKLLSQNLGSDTFILNPPNLVDKAILTLNNLKEIVGFGIPGDLSKVEKDALADLVTASASLIALASSNLKGYLALGGLNEVRFEDIFNRAGGKIQTSELALFMATKYKAQPEGSAQVFESVLKSPSKLEMLSVLRDRDDGFTNDFLRDSISSLQSVRTEINRFIAMFQEDDISAGMIFSAMAGDAAANSILDERMKANDDNAELLRELSNAVKIVTVEVSIARKQTKAGEPVNLARVLHDTIGGLVRTVSQLLHSKGDRKKAKMKAGFEKFNEELKDPSRAVTCARNQKHYSVYFPESLQEVRAVGETHKWCTSYTDSYFDNMVSGKAVLFNIKADDKIVAQGYIVRSNGGEWAMSQLRYAGNENAENDFDSQSLIAVIREMIKKDTKLSERYVA
jgi:hypothetical protein